MQKRLVFSYLRFQHHEDDLGLLSVLVNHRSCNLVHFISLFFFVIGVTPKGEDDFSGQEHQNENAK